MWNNKLEKRLESLQKIRYIELYECKISKGINDEIVSRIAIELGFSLPEELISFYKEMNGVDISWSFKKDNDEEISGSILILPLKEAIFGYDGHIESAQYENAFEDVLWNEFYSNKKIKELKQHRLFESIVGDSSFITFKLVDECVQMFYVYEEKIKPLQVSLTDYLELIIEYAGTGNIREYLISKRWEQKIRKDKELNFIAGHLG
ncbi:MAG: SMI1/KNR4 family protein [Okeania sp. SIO2D1]|uniref:SMI1/KNR4 family protein n=1 Tax=Okeania sp. SIO1F9 TaxID=2607813 RepID=UPI0013B850AB|nr:SMI1/KNR4 family protein [Okeania sp. SIO1F9]NES67193.1 SMI1/KNR4 family protein [Okeania sp. SIO2D1]NET77582.1 SMI1/KNR4 family protein [Okeania sp. SIO1F9]